MAIERKLVPLLLKRSSEVALRLVLEHETPGKAEAWLETPHPLGRYHGQRPADYFTEHGEGWYLDESSQVKVEATGAFPRV